MNRAPYMGRFTVGNVPVPLGGWLVRDGLLRSRHTRFGRGTPWQPGASSYYATEAEAVELAAWLRERAAGYPVNLMLTGAP